MPDVSATSAELFLVYATSNSKLLLVSIAKTGVTSQLCTAVPCIFTIAFFESIPRLLSENVHCLLVSLIVPPANMSDAFALYTPQHSLGGNTYDDDEEKSSTNGSDSMLQSVLNVV